MRIVMKKMFFYLILYCSTICFAFDPEGQIKGKVYDEETREPLIGANVILLNTQKGAATDRNGDFIISDIPAGNYNVAFQYIGYDRYIKSDVIVRPGRITYLNTGLYESVIEGDQVVVTAGYFQKDDREPVSNISFNNEEIRRSPGSGGDVIRILMALPSTAQVHDMANDLMVRGGSPFENGFYIDNIQIPNLNHFSVHGTTGGGIGFINSVYYPSWEWSSSFRKEIIIKPDYRIRFFL
jgi:hypothetical protein